MSKPISKEKNFNTIFQNNINTKIKRPWGSYTVLSEGNGFKVKLVEVSPKKRLSLQRHKHRSEHWVVVEGNAKVGRGKTTYYLIANESIYIPKMEIHRLENQGRSSLKIIEVQCGKILNENDIERLRDDFGR